MPKSVVDPYCPFALSRPVGLYAYGCCSLGLRVRVRVRARDRVRVTVRVRVRVRVG